jgi:hypothetical protein
MTPCFYVFCQHLENPQKIHVHQVALNLFLASAVIRLACLFSQDNEK